MPSHNMPVQGLKVATLPLDLPCSGPVTHSGEILTTGKSHGKKPDRFFSTENTVFYSDQIGKLEYGWNKRNENQDDEATRL